MKIVSLFIPQVRVREVVLRQRFIADSMITMMVMNDF